jgi:hypothetical protein
MDKVTITKPLEKLMPEYSRPNFIVESDCFESIKNDT